MRHCVTSSADGKMKQTWNMWHWQFLFVLNCVWASWSSAKVTYDSSDEQCKGCISDVTVNQSWPHIIIGDNSTQFSCLKDCVLQRAKIALYRPGGNCFCVNDAYIEQGLEINNTCCLESGEGSLRNQTLKVYNLTGIILRLQFNEFIELDKTATVEREILLCDKGEFVKNRTTLQRFVTNHTCTVYPRRTSILTGLSENKFIKESCFANLTFKNLGENTICIGVKNPATHACGNVKVLAPVTILIVRQIFTWPHLPGESVFRIKVNGTVFRLSYKFGDQSEATVKEFPESNIYDICGVDLIIKYNQTTFGRTRLAVNASNRLDDGHRRRVYVIKKKRVGFAISNIKSVDGQKNRFSLVINAIDPPVRGNITYKWSASVRGRSCKEIKISQNETSVSQITVTYVMDNDTIHCAILVRVFVDRYLLETKALRLFQGLKVQILSPGDYIRTNQLATFRLIHFPGIVLRPIWKINGTEYSRNMTFTYIFDTAGRYSISVKNLTNIRWENFIQNVLVIVQDEISLLTLQASSSRIVGKSVTFRAFVNSSDGVNYHWEFGDGRNEITLDSTISHTYKEKGVYEVKVIAENKLSSKTASINVTVRVLCPEYDVDTSFQNEKEVNVFRSRPIHLQVGMRSLRCEEPVIIKYTWKISRLDKVVWNNVSLENHDVNKTTFGIHIPPNVLECKKYRFRVTVTVSVIDDPERRYFEEFTTTINIIRTPLKVVIRGGFARYISNVTGFIKMDASMSVDPDDPESDLKFSWTCKSKPLNSPCFKSKYLVSYAGAITNAIPVPEFKENGSPYVFEVTVSVGGNESKTGHTLQLMFIDADIYSDTLLDCPSCNEGYLNPSKPIVVVSTTELSWKFFQLGGVGGDLTEFEKTKCTKPNTGDEYGQAKSTSEILPYVTCQSSAASARINAVKDAICLNSLFNGKACNVNNLGERDLPTAHRRDRLYSSVLVINKNILPRDTVILLESNDEAYNILAMRYFFVQDGPPPLTCKLSPMAGVELHQNFNLICTSRKRGPLMYKIVFTRENDDGTKMSPIILQGSIPSLTFQLPSGCNNTVKYWLTFSIENEMGVSREYCAINVNVLPFNPVPDVTIEEFLYNRTVAAREMFHGHKYAYHSLLLHNVTIIADVLNRQPKTSIKTSIFHLRTQTRMRLLDILSRVEVVGEFVTRQFANALESCTRVPAELNMVSTVTAIETLNRMLDANKRLFEERTEIPDDTRNSTVSVAVRLLKRTAAFKERKYELKIVEALQHLFKAILRGKIVSGEWIHITDNSLNATLLKFSPYRDVNISLTCGGTNVTLSWKGQKPHTRPYYCDIYGNGIQALTFHTDTFRENNTYQHAVSPLTKINVCDCKQNENVNLDFTDVEIQFPIREFQTTVWKQMENYSITPTERHSFVLNRSDNSAFKIKLITMRSTSQKSKLRLNVSCFDEKEYRGPSFSTVAHGYILTKTFFWEQFSDCIGKVNVVIGINWKIPPSRIEKINTVVNYTVVMTWTSCLSWDKNSKQWSEKTCKPEGFSSQYIDCRCSEMASDFIAVSKTPLYVLEKIAIPRETNGVMVIVVLVIFLSSVVAIIALFYLEKREHTRQRSFIFLSPSDPCHTHQYQVTVYTGHGFGAGSTAKVALVLYGENNSSYPVELSIEDHKLWRRNSRDIFVVSVRDKLGPLIGIRLWHDNSGASPSWFIEKLIIKDLASEEKWMFNCCRWLAVDKDDKKLDCKIKPYKGKRKVSFKEFRFELEKKLMDIHVWLSLVGMPSYSLFRRTERLVCCVLMVFGYLFFNALFCQTSADVLIMDSLSLFNPSWQMLKIGFIAALAVIPICLFFTVMFRFTRPIQMKKVAPFNICHNNDQIVNAHGEDNLPPSFETLRNTKRRKWSNKVVEAAECILEDFFEELDYPISARNEDLMRDIDTTIDTNSTMSNFDVVPNHPKYNSTFDPEITSQGSGSYMQFRNSEKFRFPACYRVLIWIGCIATTVAAAYLAVQLTNGFDIPTLVCYAQSVLWSFLFSFCVFQPFQALVVTVVGVLHEHFVFHVSALDDPTTESGGTPLVISDNVHTSSTERNFENPAYKRSLYLKYLQPVSKKELSRERIKLKQRNQEVETIRDLLMYSVLLVLLFLMTSIPNQPSIFVYNQGLKHVFTRQANTSSLLTWWSSSPRNIIDTLDFSNLDKTISALEGRVIIVGNPKVVMTIKFCKNVSVKEMNDDNRRCLVHEEEKVIIFEKSQKTNWIRLSDFVYKQLTQHVKAISLDFVIYSPSLNVFSAIKLSSQVLLASTLQTNFAVKTFQFCVNGSNGNILHTIYQILFTLVPILLVFRQVSSCAQKKKIGPNVCFQLESSIFVLSLISFVVMWLWIKSQYSALALLRDASYEADLLKSVQTIYHYQECLMLFLSLLQFFVFLKVVDLVGVGKLLSYYVVTFSKLLKLVLMPLFMLILLLTAFAHVGVLLFGDYFQGFSTFLKVFSLNVIYLRDINTENLFLENPNDHVILALYVIGFCVAMGITSCLVKAAFCQAHLYCLLTAKNKKLSIKAMTKISKRMGLFVRHCFNKRVQQRQVHVPVVPMHYILKEVNEQLDDILFRLVNLFTRANMPHKIVTRNTSSSSEYSNDQVEYGYTAKDHIQLLHSPNLSHDVLRYPTISSLESSLENTDQTKIGCDESTIQPLTSRVQDETLEETSVNKGETSPAVPSRYRPFIDAIFASPKPICKQMKQCDQPQVYVHDAFTEEEVSQDRGNLSEVLRDFDRPQKSTESKTNTVHSRKFRQPDFPVPVNVHLARSTATACVRTNFDISDLEITDI